MRIHWLIALVVLAGCPATSEEVRPDPDQFYFPTGLAVSPDEATLFVANANSDLRYGSGAVVPVSLAEVDDDLIGPWLSTGSPPADCQRDLTIQNIVVCDEAQAINSAGSVRIGNFATDLRVQELEDNSLRLFLAVRGDPSLTWIDVVGDSLDCGGNGEFPRCDEQHRLVEMRDDPELPGLTDEPFGLFVDSGNGYVMITHLTTGAVTLADAPTNGEERPVLVDALGGLFNADPVTGVRGAVGAAGRSPGSPTGLVYITSRSEARVQTLHVNRPDRGYPTIVAANFFFLQGVVPSDDSRGIAFRDDGERAYIVNRDPPLLHIIDTSLDDEGVPSNKLLRGVEICRQASNLVVADVGRGPRVYVSCFQNGQVWVIDPEAADVEAIIDVGRGPTGIAAAPGRGRVYVSNFLEDTIAVIDIQQGSPTENRVVLRLGVARQSGDQ